MQISSLQFDYNCGKEGKKNIQTSSLGIVVRPVMFFGTATEYTYLNRNIGFAQWLYHSP